MTISNSQPIKLTGLASHLEGFDDVVRSLDLDKIKFPCKAYLTGDVGDRNIPIVFIPSVNKESSLLWFDKEA